VAEEVAAGRLRASAIDSSHMIRRIVSATSVARPTTPAAMAVSQRVVEVLREMVRSGAWPARWLRK
jgi:LysR family nitrogen assimilation transcriptional regulator